MALVIESTTQTLVGTNDTTPTFNMPATRPDGNLYVLCAGADGFDISVVTFSGWSLADGGLAFAAEGTVDTTAWTRLGSSEPASYTGTGGPSEEWVFSVLRISGFDTTTPTDDAAGGTGANTTATAPATTATLANGVVVRMWAIDTDAPSYSSGPAGHTFRSGSSSSAGGAGSAYLGVATRDALTTASESIATAVMPGTYDDGWAAVTFVINASIGAPSGTGSIAIGTLVVAGTGGQTLSATSAVALGQVSVAGAGTHSDPPSGVGAVVLGQVVVAANGTQTLSAVGAITLGQVTAAGDGTRTDPPSGSGSIAFGQLVFAGTGTQTCSATGAITLGQISAAGQGTQENQISGTGAVALGQISCAATGAQTASGSSSIATGQLVCAGTGTATIPGSSSVLLSQIATAGSGAHTAGGGGGYDGYAPYYPLNQQHRQHRVGRVR